MDENRASLIEAIKAALSEWKKWRAQHSLLGPDPSRNDILGPLLAAIEETEVYRDVAGHPLFSGYAGVVITADRLAMPLLHRADRSDWTAEQAADWLFRILTTESAPGNVVVAVWAAAVDRQIPLGKGVTLMPFEDVPPSLMKDSLIERRREFWDKSVWVDPRFFDLPGGAIVQNVAQFPYFYDLARSFETFDNIRREMEDRLVFLGAAGAGQPLVGAMWFEYEDRDLDFNSRENRRTWLLPEVTPSLKAHAPCDGADVQRKITAYQAFPGDWKNTLQRAMKRFMLSRCRHQFVDQVLDLAIAFEILVGSRGDNAPVSWRVAVRSSQMIGGGLTERLQNRKTLADFYKLRNAGSHGGSPPPGENATLEAAIGLFRSLLETLLNHPSPPDWQSIEMEPPTYR